MDTITSISPPVTPPTARSVSQMIPDEVFAALATRPSGLTPEEIAERQARDGPNSITSGPRVRSLLGPIAVAIRPLLLPLWAAAILAFVAGETRTGYVLVFAALANTVAGALQERKAERATAALRDALPSYAHVIREGHDFHIVTSQVVVGDVLLLHGGEII